MESLTRKLLMTALFLGIGVATASAQTAVYGTLDGKRHETSTDKGKVAVLAVGASWLPLSETQAEVLGKLMNSLKGKDVVFYFIATDTVDDDEDTDATDEQLAAFAKKNKISATVLRDPRGAATVKAFKVDQLPAFIVVDKTGTMSGRPITGIQPNRDISPQLTRQIEAILQ